MARGQRDPARERFWREALRRRKASGLIVRARMSKEEYAHQGLEDGKEVSFQIRQYRVLARDTAGLPPEREARHELPPSIAEHI